MFDLDPEVLAVTLPPFVKVNKLISEISPLSAPEYIASLKHSLNEPLACSKRILSVF